MGIDELFDKKPVSGKMNSGQDRCADLEGYIDNQKQSSRLLRYLGAMTGVSTIIWAGLSFMYYQATGETESSHLVFTVLSGSACYLAVIGYRREQLRTALLEYTLEKVKEKEGAGG